MYPRNEPCADSGVISHKPGAIFRALLVFPEPLGDAEVVAEAVLMDSRTRTPLEVRVVGEEYLAIELTATAAQTAAWPPYRHVQIDARATLPGAETMITRTLTVATTKRITSDV